MFTSTLNRLIRGTVAACLTVFPACGVGSAEFGAPPAIPVEIQRLLQNSKLVLSADEQSAATRFLFVVEVMATVEGKLIKMADVVAARDGDRCATLVRYADGTPCSYFARGIYANLDADGRALRIFRAGKPRFSMKLNRGKVSMDVAQSRADAPTEFVLDVRSIVDRADAIHISYDKLIHCAKIDAASAITTVYFNRAAEGNFGVERFATQAKASGNQMWVGGFVFGPKAPVDRLLSLKFEDFQRAGMPIREVREQDLKEMQPFPGAIQLDGPEQRKLGEQFRRVIEGEVQ